MERKNKLEKELKREKEKLRAMQDDIRNMEKDLKERQHRQKISTKLPVVSVRRLCYKQVTLLVSRKLEGISEQEFGSKILFCPKDGLHEINNFEDISRVTSDRYDPITIGATHPACAVVVEVFGVALGKRLKLILTPINIVVFESYPEDQSVYRCEVQHRKTNKCNHCDVQNTRI